ncbi:MAG: NHL repeat-containing protein [Verrucomicrobiales bacterium]|nr:NHL repeat-containing protein [Verrucomicrobiales bacterium]
MKFACFFGNVFVTVVLLASPLRAGEAWRLNPEARLVLGQADFTANGEGAGNTGMRRPSDVAVDPTTGKVFVVDYANHRVLRYAAFASLQNGSAPEIVLGQPGFGATSPGRSATKFSNPRQATVDHEGRLWVADTFNGRVLRFDAASEKESGAPADGVLGQIDFVTEASPSSRSVMTSPFGVAVDAAGTLYVSEALAHRVLAFHDAATLANGANASFVLGQPNFTDLTDRTTRDGMEGPRGIAVDADGNLYVADAFNHRVLRFDDAGTLSNGANASSVLGQENFTASTFGVSTQRFSRPFDVAIDREGRLWVADLLNSRVVGFTGAVDLPGFSPADQLIGQESFTEKVVGASERRLAYADFDPVTSLDSSFGVGTGIDGRVWVADSGNHRVVAFDADRHFPDLRIGKNASATRGNNLYNASGSGQIQTETSVNGKKIRTFVRLENDGNVAETCAVKALGRHARFDLSVFLTTGGRRNVTGAVKSGVHQTDSIAPGSFRLYHHEIRAKGKEKSSRATVRAWIQASSTVDGQIDRVISLVKNRPK